MNDFSGINAGERRAADFVAAIEAAGKRRTTANGADEVVWRIWGRGDPLVLLHGGTGSWLHWVRNIEPLARDFMLIVPDLPGSGESGMPARPISAETIAAALRQGLAALIGPETRFTIAGFSMGGLIAGYLASQSGSRAECLVLVGSSGTEGTRTPMEPLVSWRRLATDEEKRAVHRKNLGILMLHDQHKIDDLAVHVQSRNAERSRVRGKHVSHTGALSRCLPGFSGRLAGIWGEFDATAAPYLAERRDRLRQFRPDASFDIFPGAGHWVQYEAHQAFNRRLRELVNSE
ncbi:MAG TPA: alpha/beta hydrolase [Xanthobacteraceae bacterium]|jgi:pimeloyl-ACP methyl ester carboxylesterase